MDIGVKVSSDGHDVKDAGMQDLIYSSKYSAFKNCLSGTATIVTDACAPGQVSKKTFEVYHGLGFIPFFRLYIYDSYSNAYTTSPTTGTKYSSWGLVDTTQLQLVSMLDNSVGGSNFPANTWNFKYFIFIP